jgi:hypothetical protein
MNMVLSVIVSHGILEEKVYNIKNIFAIYWSAEIGHASWLHYSQALLILTVSDKSNLIGCKQSHPIHYNVQLCSMCYAKEASVLESYDLPGPNGAGTCPPSSRAPAPPPPAWLLRTQSASAFNKNGSGQCSGQLRTAQSRICRHWTVYAQIVLYFSSSNAVFGNIPANCLSS